jgi:chitinase
VEVAAAGGTAPDEKRPEPSGLRIVAPSFRVNIGTVMQLRAIGSSNQGAPISWSIEEGGAGGTVSETGLYRAPIYPGVYHIVATDGLERARIELRVFTVR